MKKLAAKFLSDNEKEKIINAVKEAEKTTSGEIVPMVVSSSYNYPMANLIGGLIFGLVAGLIYAFLDEYHSLWIFLAVFMVVLILMNRLIEHIPWLKRLFLFKKRNRRGSP